MTGGAPMSPCLLCGGTVRRVLDDVRDLRFGVPGTWSIVRCDACALVQTDPRPDGAELGRLYERHYNLGGEGETAYGKARERFLFSTPYRIWLALDGDISFHAQRGPGRLLDIGCNEGRGLTIYQANGFSAEGLELNRNAARVARGRGFTVHETDIAAFAPDAPFDRAVLSNVLEHALDPRDMLRHVRRVLKPDGEVWISLPNVDSWLARRFGREWINWHVPFHITHFSADRLRRLLDEAGFAVVSQRCITPALWVAQTILARLGRGKPDPAAMFRERWLIAGVMLAVRLGLFAPLWALNRAGRGDCLVVKARVRP
jgi:SAM-dependent methyltransferase